MSAEDRVNQPRAQLFVVDRSGVSLQALGDLVPGTVHVPLGLDGDDAPAINPWDVADRRAVAPAKVEFLLRLHALIAGQAGGPNAAPPTNLQRRLLTIAIRDVYARAADCEGMASHGFLRAVLADLARQERADPRGRRDTVDAYAQLGAALRDVCSGGRYGHLLDRPTHMPVDGAPLVIVGLSAISVEMTAVVELSIIDYVSRLAARHARRISLLTDTIDAARSRSGSSPLAPALPPDTLLDGLHASYLRSRVRRGEARSIAYLHAISDVAHFLHPPTALSGAEPRTSR